MFPAVQQQSCLLLLPGELRNKIYREYILLGAENGYTYDFEAGKLRTAPDRQPIDLRLTYTCRQVACEMRGLPLRIQTVTFTTLYSPSLRIRAAKWDWLVHTKNFGTPWRQHIPIISQLVSDEMMDEFKRRHGQTILYQQMTHLRNYEEGACDGACLKLDWVSLGHEGWGDVGSHYRETWAQVFELAMSDANIKAEVQKRDSQLRGSECCIPSVCRYLPPDAPWRIPTEAELDKLAQELIGDGPGPAGTPEQHQWHQGFWDPGPGKHRFSAAAASIHFLKSIPQDVRQHLRKIVLDEDHLTVAYPSSHIRGLIPFCHENPQLRVERRASLWKNIFLWGNWANHYQLWNTDISRVACKFWPKRRRYEGDRSLPVTFPSRPVAEWMGEMARPDIPGAIKLIFDGDPIAEHSAQIFAKVIHRGAAWQRAINEVVVLENPLIEPDDFFEMKWTSDAWQCMGFPDLLKDMCANNKNPAARIRCNFDPGQPWDDEQVDALKKLGPSWGTDSNPLFFLNSWYHPTEKTVDTVAPLPSYFELWKENLLPEGEKEWT
ncbi:hypothetical protein QBC42DRAFT_277561 [Cladorrhinum samala]|uniref:Uncharacterized protein n=1 Tax=Cladorrhinum samala TaxID=585594 RepID=A0AAV9HDF5_9PEZI|nr:hypothetical protein QBC42DRAFT_277561 [Cladorrhinum samala]